MLRGLNRLILGLGELPAAPLQLVCAVLNKTAVRLSWRAPTVLGHPAMHKFVLQRQRVAVASRGATVAAAAAAASSAGTIGGSEERWEAVAEPDDEDSSWVDAPTSKGTYRYRLAAWSAYGNSPYAVSGGACTVRAVQWRRPPAPVPLGSAEAEALLAAAVAAAGNLSAGQAAAAAGAAAGVWSWSAASSAVVVALTMLLKASQLRLGSTALALCRSLAAALAGHRRQQQAVAAVDEQEQQGGLGAAASGISGGPSMRRIGSSRASLLSLDSEQAAGEELQGVLLSRAYSSSNLLGGGGQFGSMQAEASGLNAATLAAADADGAAAEELHQAKLRGAHCAAVGCHCRFDRLRDMRRKLEASGGCVMISANWLQILHMQTRSCPKLTFSLPLLLPAVPPPPLQSHYCGLCQRVYCLQHTRISPHGTRGGCGLESKCVCYACFAELAPVQQVAYKRINRLAKPAAVNASGQSAPPVAAGAAGPSSLGKQQEAAAGGSDCQQPAAVDPAVAAPAASGSDAASAAPAPASSPAARRWWKKAGGALLALVRFREAGSRLSSTC
jgi:hypothetical protein